MSKIIALLALLLLVSCSTSSIETEPRLKVFFEKTSNDLVRISIYDTISNEAVDSTSSNLNTDHLGFIPEEIPVSIDLIGIEELSVYCLDHIERKISSSFVLREPCVVATASREDVLKEVSSKYFRVLGDGSENLDAFYRKNIAEAPEEVTSAVLYWSELLHGKFTYQEITDITNFSSIDMVFKNEATDCKGFTMLTHYLLEKQGFHVNPVLVNTNPIVPVGLMDSYLGFDHIALYIPDLGEVLDVTIEGMLGETPESFPSSPMYDLRGNSYVKVSVSHESRVDFSLSEGRVTFSSVSRGINGTLKDYAKRIGDRDIQSFFESLNELNSNLYPVENYTQIIEVGRNFSEMVFSYEIDKNSSSESFVVNIPFTPRIDLVEPVEGIFDNSTCYFGGEYIVSVSGFRGNTSDSEVFFYSDKYVEISINFYDYGLLVAKLLPKADVVERRCSYEIAYAQLEAIQKWESYLNNIGLFLN